MSRHRPNAADQRERLARLADAEADGLTAADVEALLGIAAQPADDELHQWAASLLSRHYPSLAAQGPAVAARAHAALMRALRAARRSPRRRAGQHQLVSHLRDEALALVPWQSAGEVVDVAECFYGDGDGGPPAEEGQRRARDLVKSAGWHFLREGRYEEAFQLLTLVPVPAGAMDADFFRLRNALILYEQRRVHRARRSLLVVLAGVVLFLAAASPLLFLAAENPVRVARGDEAYTLLQAVYWSGETATTLGYGDIVPKTHAGRALALFDSLLGMIAIGLIAGLILGAVTARQLP